MRKFAAAALALFAVGLVTADETTKETTNTSHKLVGTWKLVSGNYGGQDFKFPEGTTMLKHVTPTQFMWATYDKDGKVFRAAGGYATLQGDVYKETPEYGISSDFDIINGKTHVFKATVEGNKWHSEGKLANGQTIDEMWERLEKK
jgi:hypothetical protein